MVKPRELTTVDQLPTYFSDEPILWAEQDIWNNKTANRCSLSPQMLILAEEFQATEGKFASILTFIFQQGQKTSFPLIEVDKCISQSLSGFCVLLMGVQAWDFASSISWLWSTACEVTSAGDERKGHCISAPVRVLLSSLRKPQVHSGPGNTQNTSVGWRSVAVHIYLCVLISQMAPHPHRSSGCMLTW